MPPDNAVPPRPRSAFDERAYNATVAELAEQAAAEREALLGGDVEFDPTFTRP